MNNYIDQFGRYHDSPVTSSEPIPSNNGWIYSSYAHKLGITLEKLLLQKCAQKCKQYREEGKIFYTRSPYDFEPVISRDEMIGMSALQLIPITFFYRNNWNFSPYPIPKFSLIQLIKQLWQLRPTIKLVTNPTVTIFTLPTLEWKHRNYFWQNNLDQLYRFAFSLPLQDRAFIYRCNNIKPPIFYTIYEKLSNLLPNKTNSSKLIQWLKTGDKPDLAVFEAYFGPEHDFCKNIRGEI